MSPEKSPIHTNELESKGRAVLVENQDTGAIDVLQTAGISGRRLELDGSVTPTELVGIAEGPRDIAMKGGTFVERESLQPETQEQLARNLSELPLRGDHIVAKFGGKLIYAEVDDYATLENGQKVAIVRNSVGDYKNVDLRALTPETQAALETARLKQVLQESVGQIALRSII